MIVITGASSGIGMELAKLYSEAGKKVVNVSRRSSEFASVNIQKDLQDGTQIKAAAKAVADIAEPIEAVINSVGVYTNQDFGKLTEEEIKRIMASNVKAPMLFISELIDRIKKDEADVLNVVSKAGVQGSAHNPIYSSSKWAERGFTLSLQEALQETPCRVISFCPGGIQTELFEKVNADVNTKKLDVA